MVIHQFHYLADSQIISSGQRIQAALTAESIRIDAPQGPAASLSSDRSFGETLVNLLATKPPRWACPGPEDASDLAAAAGARRLAGFPDPPAGSRGTD